MLTLCCWVSRCNLRALVLMGRRVAVPGAVEFSGPPLESPLSANVNWSSLLIAPGVALDRSTIGEAIELQQHVPPCCTPQAEEEPPDQYASAQPLRSMLRVQCGVVQYSTGLDSTVQ